MRGTNKLLACVGLGIAVVASAVLASAPAAYAVTFTTSGEPTQYSLGDAIGPLSNYDQLTVSAGGGTLQTGTIVLNQLDFVAGINAIVPAFYQNTYSIAETMTVSDGGGTQTLTIPFNLNIDYSDTLTVIGGNLFTFVAGGTTWQLSVNGLTLGPNPGGAMFGNLTAQVSNTPLPAALPFFVAGLGAMGLLGWRRKRKSSAVIAVA